MELHGYITYLDAIEEAFIRQEVQKGLTAWNPKNPRDRDDYIEALKDEADGRLFDLRDGIGAIVSALAIRRAQLTVGELGGAVRENLSDVVNAAESLFSTFAEWAGSFAVPGKIETPDFGCGTHRNDNDWRLSEDDWRHSSNNTSSSSRSSNDDPVIPWTNDDSDNGPRPNHSSPTRVTSPSTGERVYDRGVEDEDGPGRAIPTSKPSKKDDDPVHGYDEVGIDVVLPLILDLDGSGVEVTELSHSTVFVDATGDGLLNRTAWAAEGNGVLFYDPDNTGEITEKRQYVFTEWDPTATSDMEALRSVFDSNGDGVFDALDDEWANFKVMVTNEDGSRVAQAFGTGNDELDITSIDLTADATHLELPDGSVITGQTTFTWGNGSTGTVADTQLVVEADGHRVEQVASGGGSVTRTEVSTGYDSDGSIAFVITSATTSDGASITNSYDDNGDGVVDRLQTIVTAVVSGETVETVTNKLGSDAATAVLANQTVEA